jgi:hypothetical protein
VTQVARVEPGEKTMLIILPALLMNAAEIRVVAIESTEAAPSAVEASAPTTSKINISKKLLESHINEAIIESPKQSESIATIDSLGRVTIECEVREKQSTASTEQEQ